MIPPNMVDPIAKIYFSFTISFLLVGSVRIYLLDLEQKDGNEIKK